MLENKHLVAGLNALSRAHERDFFSDGHRGAAVIAAYYLCHEQNLASGTQAVIDQCLGNDLESNDLFVPPTERHDEVVTTEDIVNVLAEKIGVFKMAGHDVIFSSAALKAFRQVPDYATPARVRGICKLVRCFDAKEVDSIAMADDVPKLEDQDDLVEFIFWEYLGCLARFKGYGQGWAGHLMTYCQALIALFEMGYRDLAHAGHPALRTMIALVRRGPQKGDRRIPDHSRNRWTPLDLEYWKVKRPTLSGLGHAYKYPYSYYNLRSRLKNRQLQEQCDAESYKIF